MAVVGCSCVGNFSRASPRKIHSILRNIKLNRTISVSAQKYDSSSQHCMETIRKYDYENFLCALLLPQGARSVAFAIRSFNVELSQITENVSKKDLAIARLTFWKQFINQVDDVIRKYDLPKHWMRRMIEAREKYFGDKPFLTSEDVEDYGEKTNSAVYYLILKSLGINNIECDHVASHVGKAQSISNLIRSVPHNATHQRVALPFDILAQNGVSQEDFVRGRQDEASENVIFSLANLANKHVETARSLIKSVPTEARPCFLPLVAVNSYLQRLQKENFNVFSANLQQRDNLLAMSLYWNKLRRTF